MYYSNAIEKFTTFNRDFRLIRMCVHKGLFQKISTTPACRNRSREQETHDDRNEDSSSNCRAIPGDPLITSS